MSADAESSRSKLEPRRAPTVAALAYYAQVAGHWHHVNENKKLACQAATGIGAVSRQLSVEPRQERRWPPGPRPVGAACQFGRSLKNLTLRLRPQADSDTDWHWHCIQVPNYSASELFLKE